MEYLTRKDYAEKKGVSPQAVGAIKHVLKTKQWNGHTLYADCERNDRWFAKPSHNRGRSVGGRKKAVEEKLS